MIHISRADRHRRAVVDLDSARARRALEDYARRHASDDIDLEELRPLIDQASDAGLDLATIGALAEGRRA